MATDANILMGYKPIKTANPMEMYEAGQRIEQNRLTGLMNNMKMDEYQRGVERSGSLRDITRGFGKDSAENVGRLHQGGFLKEASDLQKADGDFAKDAATTGKTRLEATGIAMQHHRDSVHLIQSADDVKRWVTAGFENPVLNPVFASRGTLEQQLQNVGSQVVTPAQIESFKQLAGVNADTFIKHTRPDANARLQAETTLTTNAVNDKTKRDGQVLTDNRARDANANLTPDGGTNQSVLNKQNGKAPAGFRWKSDGGLESIPGGPADQKSQNTEAGKQTVDTVVATLRSAYESLDKGGGITSTNEGAFSNLSRSASKSSLGQILGGAVGSSNQKERDSIAQTRPLLLQAIMKATGMSAKQMDSNAELKLYLATATDPTLSLQANREALERIESLYGSKSVTAAQPPTTKPDAAGMEAEMRKRGLIK